MRLTLLFTLVLFGFGASAQVTLSGKVSDKEGKGVPFASIYIKGTTKGTSANIEGEYSLNLQPGQYEVLYRAVGYKQESQNVSLGKNTILNITLTGEVYELGGITINGNG